MNIYNRSHDKQYNKAIAVLSNGSCVPIKFPASIEQNENEELCFFGNIRLFNKKIYVYTNFQPIEEEEKRFCGYTEIYGRVTKVDKKFDSYIIDCGNNAFVPLKSKRNFEVDDVINISGKFI